MNACMGTPMCVCACKYVYVLVRYSVALCRYSMCAVSAYCVRVPHVCHVCSCIRCLCTSVYMCACFGMCVGSCYGCQHELAIKR